jgi:hypothetical protein
VLKRLLKKIKQFASLLSSYVLYLRRSQIHQANVKYITLDISSPHLYHRYLYNLIKFLRLDAYHVYIPGGFRQFKKYKCGNKYLGYLIKDKEVVFKRPQGEMLLAIADDNLSVDYFHLAENKVENDSFHVPMSMYPKFYRDNLFKVKPYLKPRINSAFMIGNFDKHSYNRLDQSIFKMPSRVQSKTILKNMSDVTFVINVSDLELFLNKTHHSAIIIADRSKFSIPESQLLEVLSKFNFYIALSGVVMPLSHNVIEAMAVACIPVIHERYARLFHPRLEHLLNCFIINEESNYEEFILFQNTLNESDLQILRENVLSYYSKHLSPRSVTKKLLSKKWDQIFLIGEHYSINLIEESSKNS